MKTPEEIKKGLECCNTFYNCQQCPYDRDEEGWSCVIERNSDALALIRQLEAKLAEYEKPLVPMTLSQLMEIYNDRENHVWPFNIPPYLLVESDGKKEEFCGWASWSDIKLMLEREHLRYNQDNYGKTWHCWLRRPTDEERKAAKWDKCG